MNILMIHPHDIYSDLEPWTSRITNLAKEFVERGHRVKLVYHLVDASLSPEEASLRQEFAFETIPLIRFQRTLLKKLKIIVDLADWADIIHFQKCLPHGALPAIWAAYRLGNPVHYDWDDWEYEIYNYRPMNRLVGKSIDTFEKIIPGLVDTVSVASQSLKELCLERGVRADRIFESHVGADLRMFSPNVNGGGVRRNHDLEGPIVLYLGQLHGAQYAELFLQAAKVILSRRDGVNFMVVGIGDRFGELHALAERLDIGHKIVFTGAVNHEMVPQYIAAADIAVACFEDNKQTRCKSPLKIVEYMASGKAVVASDVGEATRMLRGCGILTKPGDVNSLVHGIEELLDDPQLGVQLGLKARKRAEEIYNWGVTASNLLQAYHLSLEICGKRSGHRRNDGNRRTDGTSKKGKYRNTKGGIRGFLDRNRDLLGIMNGAKVFAGPYLVQLDLTNNCNNDCIGCWCNSPLLGDKAMDSETKKQTLPFDRVASLLDELHNLGTREVYFAGGGEPFMHPRFMEVLELVKGYGMVVHINTNFTLVDRSKAEKMVSLGIDHLTISMWAGTAETYSKTHPNKMEETFEQILGVLDHLVSLKKERPFIKLYNVISKINCHEIDTMVDLALRMGVESVEFTMVDVIPGYTDTLLLSEQERRCLVDSCHMVRDKVERLNRDREKKLQLFRFDEFIRRISSEDTNNGSYDKNVIDSIPCYVGWFFARILPDGNVNSCLKSHRIPVGNIHQNDFKEIWLSEKQQEFRKETNVYKKESPYFAMIGNDPSAKIGCHRSCDNLGHNQYIHHRITSMGLGKKLALQSGRFLAKPYN